MAVPPTSEKRRITVLPHHSARLDQLAAERDVTPNVILDEILEEVLVIAPRRLERERAQA